MQNHQIVEFGAGKSVGFSRLKITSSVDDILCRIHALEDEMELSAPDFDKIKNLCYGLICRLPIPVFLMQDTFLLRARENKDGELFNSVSQISYNPYASAGRFNRQNEPVFYGALPITTHQASGQLTTICESCKELFDSTSTATRKYFTVGKWTVVKPVPTIVLTFFDDAENVSWHLGNLNPGYRRFLASVCDQQDLEKCWRVYSFFSAYAAKKFDTADKYILTTAFFHALQHFYGNEIAVLYSSSMTENKGLNVVLTKALVDSGYLQFDGAIMFRTLRNPSDYYNHTTVPCTNYATLDSDKLFRFRYVL